VGGCYRKIAIEDAIMQAIKEKYTASFNTPFMINPLNLDLGFLGRGLATKEVLDGSYEIPEGVDPFTSAYIQHLNRPTQIKPDVVHPASISIETYRNY
jgi:hypothetical protein